MRFNRISLFQHRMNQNNQHVVTIESKNGGLPIAFKGFFVQARAVKSNGSSNPLGSWDVSGANGLAKVTHYTDMTQMVKLGRVNPGSLWPRWMSSRNLGFTFLLIIFVQLLFGSLV